MPGVPEHPAHVAAHIRVMTNNPAEAANLDKFRNKANGRFGNRPFSEPEFTLAPAAAAYESRGNELRAAAEDRDREFMAARREMNDSRARIAAHELQAMGMEPGRVLIEGDDKYWYVREAYGTDGTALHENQLVQIQDAMKEAGVQYDVRYRVDGVDLSQLSGNGTEAGDDSPAGYVGRMVEDMGRAFDAAGLEEEDPQIKARDLLTNLRHWADANGVDLEQALSGSYNVYLDESSAARDRTA